MKCEYCEQDRWISRKNYSVCDGCGCRVAKAGPSTPVNEVYQQAYWDRLASQGQAQHSQLQQQASAMAQAQYMGQQVSYNKSALEALFGRGL